MTVTKKDVNRNIVHGVLLLIASILIIIPPRGSKTDYPLPDNAAVLVDLQENVPLVSKNIDSDMEVLEVLNFKKKGNPENQAQLKILGTVECRVKNSQGAEMIYATEIVAVYSPDKESESYIFKDLESRDQSK